MGMITNADGPCTCLCPFAPTNSNTTPQMGTRPISSVCLVCFGRGSTLVKMSTVCSGSRQLSMYTMFCCTSSRTQCHRTAICLERLWNCGFLAMAIDPSLLPRINVGISLWSKPSSVKRLLSQHTLRAASESATYSASVEERAVATCFLELQV